MENQEKELEEGKNEEEEKLKKETKRTPRTILIQWLWKSCCLCLFL